MSDVYRYLRQVQIFGEDHQRSLMSARAHVDGDEIGAMVEALYLIGAGVGTVDVESEAIADAVRALNPTVAVTVTRRMQAAAEEPEFADELAGFTDPTAKRVARGALAALARLTPPTHAPSRARGGSGT